MKIFKIVYMLIWLLAVLFVSGCTSTFETDREKVTGLSSSQVLSLARDYYEYESAQNELAKIYGPHIPYFGVETIMSASDWPKNILLPRGETIIMPDGTIVEIDYTNTSRYQLQEPCPSNPPYIKTISTNQTMPDGTIIIYHYCD